MGNTGAANDILDDWDGVPPPEAFQPGGIHAYTRPLLIVDINTGILYAKRVDGTVVAIGPAAAGGVSSGTWMPALTSTGAYLGQTYSAQVGTSLRVGDHIFLEFLVALTARGMLPGVVQLSGLPFPPIVDDTVRLDAWSNLHTPVVGLAAHLVAGSSSATLHKLVGASADSTAAALVRADLTNTAQLVGTLIYRTGP